MKTKNLLFLTAFLIGGVLSSSAQGYNDDDIYYNPAKDTKTKQQKTQKTTVVKNNISYYDSSLGGHTYAGSDAYQVTGTSTRDVDEYNRRGAYATTADTTGVQQSDGDDFTYTRRLEKYHNSDIVIDLNDPDLIEYYYANEPNINIYINTPYGYYPWRYGFGWNNPWNGWYSDWAWGWGPSWSWSWGWGPSWAWNWGWGPSWAWGPSWSWGWGPSWGWSSPGWGWGGGGILAHNPAAYAPNGRRTFGGGSGSVGSVRPSGSYRQNAIAGSNRGSGSVGQYRPGATANSNSAASVSRPANSNSNQNSYGTTTGNRNNRNSNTNSNNSFNNSNSYSPSRSSGSSVGGGGGFGGGGGASHRGGRR